jgi:predicted phage-related endonuclease
VKIFIFFANTLQNLFQTLQNNLEKSQKNLQPSLEIIKNNKLFSKISNFFFKFNFFKSPNRKTKQFLLKNAQIFEKKKKMSHIRKKALYLQFCMGTPEGHPKSIVFSKNPTKFVGSTQNP